MAKQSVLRPKPLPVAKAEYDQTDERINRRYIEQTHNVLAEQGRDGIEHRSKEATLALRPFQFLLMGA